MGVMKNLVEQNTDAANKTTAAITALQATIQKQQGDRLGPLRSGFRTDPGPERFPRRIESPPCEGQQAAGRHAVRATESPGLPARQLPRNAGPGDAPPPDVLYANALRDYNGGKNDLASQEFSDYVKFYPNTDLAGNSYFYLAELQFKSANYKQAVTNYDQVLQNFPSGTKAASAQLKKGFALIELGQTDDGVQNSAT